VDLIYTFATSLSSEFKCYSLPDGSILTREKLCIVIRLNRNFLESPKIIDPCVECKTKDNLAFLVFNVNVVTDCNYPNLCYNCFDRIRPMSIFIRQQHLFIEKVEILHQYIVISKGK